MRALRLRAQAEGVVVCVLDDGGPRIIPSETDAGIMQSRAVWKAEAACENDGEEEEAGSLEGRRKAGLLEVQVRRRRDRPGVRMRSSSCIVSAEVVSSVEV